MRVAVVGAGPAGVYSARELVEAGRGLAVDVFDRVPAPYGLVRYGVAPDHPKTKRIAAELARTLGRPDVRFFGHVTYGVDLGLDDLLSCYHAVVFAVGAGEGGLMGVPGEDLPGVGSAAQLVAWYNAHPHADDSFPRRVLAGRDVAVVGAGNVALDVARVLVGGPHRLADSDVPTKVLDLLRGSRVTDVRVLARRGPADARFTVPELTELGRLDDVDVVVDPADLVDADPGGSRRARSVLRLLHDWATRPAGSAPRRIHLCFRSRPVAVRGGNRSADRRGGVGVEGLLVDRRGGTTTVPAHAVVRAIGYRGAPLPGLPFDDVTGTVRNRHGRVVAADGTRLPRLYVAGWIKRGASGVIGANRVDAAETVRALLEDSDGFPAPLKLSAAAVPTLLRDRGVRFVTWPGWLRLDAYEVALGRSSGRPRVSVDDLATMLTVTRAGEL